MIVGRRGLIAGGAIAAKAMKKYARLTEQFEAAGGEIRSVTAGSSSIRTMRMPCARAKSMSALS